MYGRYEHKGSSRCPLKMHPDVNTDPTLNWADSAAGKAWAQKGYKFIPSSIRQGSKERLSSLPRADAKSKGDAKPAKPTEPQKEKGNSQPQKKHKGKTECCLLCQTCDTGIPQVASIVKTHEPRTTQEHMVGQPQR